MLYIKLILLFILNIIHIKSFSFGSGSSPIIDINDNDWRKILEGEWIIKFYSPWCGACKDMVMGWNHIATWSSDAEPKLNVGDIDATKNPGLIGRFIITKLPTIYHVKNGVFREYSGSRDSNQIWSFISDRKYRSLSPVFWLFSPTSLPMEFVSFFFRLASAIRNIHTIVTETLHLPAPISYMFFACFTIFLGIIFAALCMIGCDYILSGRFLSSSNRLGGYMFSDIQPLDSQDQRSFADIPDVIEDDIVYPEDSGCHGDNDADDDQVMKVAQLGQGLYPGHDANHYGGNATRRRIR